MASLVAFIRIHYISKLKKNNAGGSVLLSFLRDCRQIINPMKQLIAILLLTGVFGGYAQNNTLEIQSVKKIYTDEEGHLQYGAALYNGQFVLLLKINGKPFIRKFMSGGFSIAIDTNGKSKSHVLLTSENKIKKRHTTTTPKKEPPQPPKSKQVDLPLSTKGLLLCSQPNDTSQKCLPHCSLNFLNDSTILVLITLPAERVAKNLSVVHGRQLGITIVNFKGNMANDLPPMPPGEGPPMGDDPGNYPPLPPAGLDENLFRDITTHFTFVTGSE